MTGQASIAFGLALLASVIWVFLEITFRLRRLNARLRLIEDLLVTLARLWDRPPEEVRARLTRVIAQEIDRRKVEDRRMTQRRSE